MSAPAFQDSPSPAMAWRSTGATLADFVASARRVGSAFGSASFSNDRLARFPDGYPVRMAGMDFPPRRRRCQLLGHARIAISIREGHYGLVTCGLMGNSAEEAGRMWAPFAAEADEVVNSFVLDAAQWRFESGSAFLDGITRTTLFPAPPPW
ncbi:MULTISPECIES: hypothetical protein [unclassified Mesorhizobium]|nr:MULTISPECIES: hypothetical protein [unclassified Mesorhizobium]RUW02520.1 hypothetical protein EOA49_06370 [Mesorhizobium sp. M1A.F.Ca.IN.020.04.1.1]RUW16417.1 hypothetical protein EOA53_00575 [Mesorhizobium sp. M1A.F.Ca.IN.020.03.1.1]RWF63371.1 MAG: hypothetical protein EOQ34_30385 [Mesorhizobium sp.]RWG08928.1 MAG: hypothetical protein EOQ58_30090 [Mesorhizobium sp.]RWG31862.1 MAG: hypothetical protein EOQ61_11975 [Mesorhizobium sp.]